jgi:hypothetical protein
LTSSEGLHAFVQLIARTKLIAASHGNERCQSDRKKNSVLQIALHEMLSLVMTAPAE